VFTLPAPSYIRAVVPNSHDAVPVRPAATVIAARSTAGADLEVVMVRRHTSAVFMAGARVFPGGSLDAVDRGDLAASAVSWDGDPSEFAWRAAALRELAEEAGIVVADRQVETAGRLGGDVYSAVLEAGTTLDATRLHYLSNWVTPVGEPRRFDTRFYVVVVGEETAATSDDREVFDAIWVEPDEALRRGRDGTWQIEFPTQIHLELLAELGDIDALVEHARLVVPQRIEPRMAVDDDGTVLFLLPGDPAYAGATGAD
jgi:8-oxo-dGTP pyrophosphatase MutT (NUDIX family)